MNLVNKSFQMKTTEQKQEKNSFKFKQVDEKKENLVKELVAMGFTEQQSQNAVNSFRVVDKNLAIEYILSMQNMGLKSEQSAEKNNQNMIEEKSEIQKYQLDSRKQKSIEYWF